MKDWILQRQFFLAAETTIPNSSGKKSDNQDTSGTCITIIMNVIIIMRNAQAICTFRIVQAKKDKAQPKTTGSSTSRVLHSGSFSSLSMGEMPGLMEGCDVAGASRDTRNKSHF